MLALIMFGLYFGLFICFILYMKKLGKKRALFAKKESKIANNQNRKKRNVKQK